jgi:hypothetical protein
MFRNYSNLSSIRFSYARSLALAVGTKSRQAFFVPRIMAFRSFDIARSSLAGKMVFRSYQFQPTAFRGVSR